MGRWSREVAREFVDWLNQPTGLDLLDGGCGTGPLSATILAHRAPRSVLGVDPSEGFVTHAREGIVDGGVRFEVARAESLPCAYDSIDVVASVEPGQSPGVRTLTGAWRGSRRRGRSAPRPEGVDRRSTEIRGP